MRALDEYLNKIVAIIHETESGKITWQKSSQTTFFWRTTGPVEEKVIISVQKSTTKRRNASRQIVSDSNYIFQITMEPKETIVNLSSNEYTDTPLRQVLESLYSTAEYSADKRSIDFFDSILKKNSIS